MKRADHLNPPNGQWTSNQVFVGQSSTSDSFVPGILTVSNSSAPVTTFNATSLGLT